MNADELGPAPSSDTPVVDRLWEGLGAWLGGVLAASGLALAMAATLGWPRRAAAELSTTQLAVLGVQALASSAGLARAGRALCRRYPLAVGVAFVAAVPAALALLMAAEWRDPSTPHASWARLLGDGVRLAALEAVPVGYVLWRVRAPRRESAAAITPPA
ncbi:MAG TPA: hypothetical protein VFS40_09455 [Gemmatimonadales bacterium]|nr:hypothetical protein [Gemmatimonadales bacterium]